MKKICAIIVNPTSCNGMGLTSWKKIQDDLPFSDTRVFISPFFFNLDLLESQLEDWLRQGIRRFLAVGGDGTCNTLLNGLLHASANLQIPSTDIIYGAIGTGSSNDFHKPFLQKTKGFPCRMNFESPLLTDLCWWAPKDGPRRYFLVNASLGITAKADGYFNTHLRALKKISPTLSILWAVLRTSFLYQNHSCTLSLYGTRQVTNLGIVRNPHFLGDFSYPSGETPNSGHFGIYLCDNLSKWESLCTWKAFLRGRFFGTKLYQCRGTTFSIQSKTPFWVASDGEVSQQTHITFGIDRGRIQLCT